LSDCGIFFFEFLFFTITTMPHIFGDFPAEFSLPEKSTIAILPVPYDGTSTWMKGADKGPLALVETSQFLEMYDTETDSEPFRVGIFVTDEVLEKSSPEKMTDAVFESTKKLLLDGKFVALLGGEHSVSFGAIKAHHEKHPNMSVLQFDAHTDLRDEYHDSRYNHACVMARAREICPVLAVGIRSMDISERKYLQEGNIFLAENIVGKTDWIPKMIERLTDEVYITIDLDVLDPSIMPATGTPEPGGLGWYEILYILREVSKHKKIVGIDIVELLPKEGTESAVFLAAKLLYKLIGYIFEKDSRVKEITS
jgi:agmatinase